MYYQLLKHTHSTLRWFILALLISTLISALYNYASNKHWTSGNFKLALGTLIVSHIQFLLGFVLFIISPKVVFSAESMSNSFLRFFLLEHTMLMLIAITLITIGYARSKYIIHERKKLSRLILYYGIAFIIIMVAIPWPWMNLSAGWY